MVSTVPAGCFVAPQLESAGLWSSGPDPRTRSGRSPALTPISKSPGLPLPPALGTQNRPRRGTLSAGDARASSYVVVPIQLNPSPAHAVLKKSVEVRDVPEGSVCMTSLMTGVLRRLLAVTAMLCMLVATTPSLLAVTAQSQEKPAARPAAGKG